MRHCRSHLSAMGREQELIQAVKNGDVPGVQKLVAKIKASKSSEYLGAELLLPLAPAGHGRVAWAVRGAGSASALRCEG